MITLKNIHTNETFTVELVSRKFTWQSVWIVKFNGDIETVTASQGWMEVK